MEVRRWLASRYCLLLVVPLVTMACAGCRTDRGGRVEHPSPAPSVRPPVGQLVTWELRAPGGTFHTSPAWTSSGEQVYFLRRPVEISGSVLGEVWRTDGEGRNAERILQLSPWVDRIQWHAEGRQIVYLAPSETEANPVLVRVPVDGGPEARIELGHEDARYGALSPDGSTYAYVAGHPGGRLYLVPATGGEPREVEEAGEVDSVFSWSPDGKRLAVGGLDPFDVPRLRVIDLAQRTTSEIASDLTDGVRWAAWSPDGARLAFIAQAHGSKRVFLARADGADPAPFGGEHASPHGLAWSPDAQRLVVAEFRPSGSAELKCYPIVEEAQADAAGAPGFFVFKAPEADTGATTARTPLVRFAADGRTQRVVDPVGGFPVAVPGRRGVAYVRFASDTTEIVWVPSSDGATEAVWPGQEDDAPYLCAFSEDGTSIAVATRRGVWIGEGPHFQEGRRLLLAKEPRRGRFDVHRLAWFPGRGEILIQHVADGVARVERVDTLSGKRTVLPETWKQAAPLRDGALLVVLSEDTDKGKANTLCRAVEDGQVRTIAQLGGGIIGGLEVSQDGRVCLLIRALTEEADTVALVVITLADGSTRTLEEGAILQALPSPDGTRALAFVCDPSLRHQNEVPGALVEYDLATGRSQVLLAHLSAGAPALLQYMGFPVRLFDWER